MGLPATSAGSRAGITRRDLAIESTFLLAFVLLVFLPLELPRWVFFTALAIVIVGHLAWEFFHHPWAVEARSERGEFAWRVRGSRGSRRALAEVAAALEGGDRSVVPAGGERLLPGSYDAVRVLSRKR